MNICLHPAGKPLKGKLEQNDNNSFFSNVWRQTRVTDFLPIKTVFVYKVFILSLSFSLFLFLYWRRRWRQMYSHIEYVFLTIDLSLTALGRTKAESASTYVEIINLGDRIGKILGEDSVQTITIVTDKANVIVRRKDTKTVTATVVESWDIYIYILESLFFFAQGI